MNSNEKELVFENIKKLSDKIKKEINIKNKELIK